MFSVLMQIRLFEKTSRQKSENQNCARSIFIMSSERVCAQNFNATRIKTLSHLVTEIRPKIEVLSLALLFPVKGTKALRRHSVVTSWIPSTGTSPYRVHVFDLLHNTRKV